MPHGTAVSSPYVLIIQDSGLTLRRGWEGPQVVASWSNDTALSVKLLKKEKTYATSDTDADATVVYTGAGTNYADTVVEHLVTYYYTLYIETVAYSGTYVETSKGKILAIDNRPEVEWIEQVAVISSTTVAEPGAPSTGDRYILPTGATGAVWAGDDGKIGEWNGASWDFTVPLDRYQVYVTDTDVTVVYHASDSAWVESYTGYRNSLYALLNEFDRVDDKTTKADIYFSTSSSDLQGEKFHFTANDTATRLYTLQRFLRLFDMPVGEIKGLIDNFVNFYDMDNVDRDFVLKAAALIGLDDNTSLSDEQRRFFATALSAFYPEAGTIVNINIAIRQWLGPAITYVLKEYKDQIVHTPYYATPLGGSPQVFGCQLPDISTPDPNALTVNDTLCYVATTTPEDLIHYRGIGIWLDDPFDYESFIFLDPVISATTVAQPGSPATGDRYVLTAAATGAAWSGNDLKIAEWNGASWDLTTPLVDNAVVVTDTSSTIVYRGVYSSGTWDTAVDRTRFNLLQWWLNNYASPGSSIIQFLEY
jgi:hypothetical protein